MERWRTARKSDPEFRTLLDGSFSRDHRALPRRSLNVGGASEEATFEIIPLDEIERPNALAIALHSLRPETLILSLGPLIATLAHLALRRELPDVSFALLAVLGILLFHASLNLLNDFVDHMSGADRLNSLGGSRAIQRGWARASSFRAWGIALLGAAILIGALLGVQKPTVLMPIGACALGAAFYLTWGKSIKRRITGAREASIFALGGPLLTLGFTAAAARGGWQEAMLACTSPSTSALGVAFGFSALLYSVLGNFEGIMRDSLDGVATLTARLGFDRAKRLIASTACAAACASVVYALAEDAWPWLAPMLVASLGACTFAALIPMRAPSPLSSSLRHVRNRALILHWSISGGVLFGAILKIVAVHGVRWPWSIG